MSELCITSATTSNEKPSRFRFDLFPIKLGFFDAYVFSLRTKCQFHKDNRFETEYINNLLKQIYLSASLSRPAPYSPSFIISQSMTLHACLTNMFAGNVTDDRYSYRSRWEKENNQVLSPRLPCNARVAHQSRM